MVLTDERPAHPGRQLPLVPEQHGAGHGAERHLGSASTRITTSEQNAARVARAFLKYPVVDKRAELIIIKSVPSRVKRRSLMSCSPVSTPSVRISSPDAAIFACPAASRAISCPQRSGEVLMGVHYPRAPEAFSGILARCATKNDARRRRFFTQDGMGSDAAPARLPAWLLPETEESPLIGKTAVDRQRAVDGNTAVRGTMGVFRSLPLCRRRFPCRFHCPFDDLRRIKRQRTCRRDGSVASYPYSQFAGESVITLWLLSIWMDVPGSC